jgi:homopolymeric O-antigen transport system ATP-binding protein
MVEKMVLTDRYSTRHSGSTISTAKQTGSVPGKAMSQTVICVENLSKKYEITLGRLRHDTLRDQISDGISSLFQSNRRSRTERETFWALRDVSFDVKRAEVIGLIGKNGAGKSTLLKILSRITMPTKGFAEIRGRVASLLEVGTGFHNELTGRENIYLNGAILGMKKAEIDRNFDEIVAFSEVEKFIDTPVKHYSSGMYVRLAFAVAAHLEPEILIVDEVLAVGDAAFQKKCLGKMDNVAKQGRTVLFVSHNMTAVEALCTRGIYLSEGCVVSDAPILESIRCYIAESSNSTSQSLAERSDRYGDGRLRFTAWWIEDQEGLRVNNVIVGQNVRFCFAYKAAKTLRNVHVAFNLQEQIGNPIVNCNTSSVDQDFAVVPEEGIFVCEIKKFPLRASRYIGNLFCKVQDSLADWVQHAFVAEVMDGDFYGTGKLPDQGRVLLSQGWAVRETQ